MAVGAAGLVVSGRFVVTDGHFPVGLLLRRSFKNDKGLSAMTPTTRRPRVRGMARQRPARDEAGFSTIDALVGLTILSMCLALGLGAQASARRVADRAGEVRAASTLLDSLLVRDLGQAQSADGVSGVLAWRVVQTRASEPGPVPLCVFRAEVRRPGTGRIWRRETLKVCRI